AEAGILGAMPSLNARMPEAFEEILRQVRAKTDKPFAINLTIGLTEPGRLQRDVELCLEYEVPALITSYGNPTPIVAAAKTKGIFVMHDVIQLQHAKKAVAAGVDAIIGVSQGAGGHAGTVNPYVLVPYLRRHLPVPIVAAGCIGGGEQVAASLALGAELAYMGTRFVACAEAGAPDAYKQMLVDATHDDIVYTDEVSGIHANFLKQTLPSERIASRDDAPKRWKEIWSAGQGVSLIDEVKPMGAIVEDIVREYHDAVARLRG
ncbi:MAG: nitronate monooxygenase, partial [Myxococcales bacterium]|nr:nitronate monooxygenase [Myxococcales bacterium]